MNHQQIFDTVVAHLRKQGQKAVSKKGVCQYRTQDGLKCAVGCLIRDEEYSEEIEGHGITFLVGDDVASLSSFRERVANHSNLSLLILLQRVHDKDFVYEWESGFQWVAQTCNLQYTPPNGSAL